MTDSAVTVVVTRSVRPGCLEAYESWLHRVGAAAAQFPGHLGLTVLRPRAGSRQYSLVFRFDTAEHLLAWEESDARAAHAAEADSLCERADRQQASGVEAWFSLPEQSTRAPPKWKMAVVSWLVAFPTIRVLNATLGAWLTPLPVLVRGAAVGLVMIVFMTYAAMPFVTRRLSFWLYPEATDEGSNHA